VIRKKRHSLVKILQNQWVETMRDVMTCPMPCSCNTTCICITSHVYFYHLK